MVAGVPQSGPLRMSHFLGKGPLGHGATSLSAAELGQGLSSLQGTRFLVTSNITTFGGTVRWVCDPTNAFPAYTMAFLPTGTPEGVPMLSITYEGSFEARVPYSTLGISNTAAWALTVAVEPGGFRIYTPRGAEGTFYGVQPGSPGSSLARLEVADGMAVRRTMSVRCLYTYTGAEQLFTVPPSVTSLYFKLWGGAGVGNAGLGGGGGFTSALLAVSPGQVLRIITGGAGAWGVGGFGGGGSGNGTSVAGGGRSAVRLSGAWRTSSRPAGRGGGSYGQTGGGGAGGGLVGQNGHGGSTGGTQTAGGAAGGDDKALVEETGEDGVGTEGVVDEVGDAGDGVRLERGAGGALALRFLGGDDRIQALLAAASYIGAAQRTGCRGLN
eukprot:tig00000492_g1417.t1